MVVSKKTRGLESTFHAVIACRCDSRSESAAGLVYLDRREQTRWTTGFARKDYVTGACDSWRFQAFFFSFFPFDWSWSGRESRTPENQNRRRKRSSTVVASHLGSTATNPSWTGHEISANQQARPESRTDL